MADIWVVPVPIAIIKRVEQVFIDNGCPYWTDGSFSDAQIAEYKTRKHLGDTKRLINLSDFYDWVVNNNMGQAIKAELSDVLSSSEIVDWLRANRKRRSVSIELG